MHLRALLISIVCTLLALAAASDAASNALKRSAPKQAAGLPLTNGFALSRQASIILGSDIEEGDQIKDVDDPAVLARVANLSVAAYGKEPFDRAAVRNLALVAAARGDENLARAAMDGVHRMTRRDLAANLWLAQSAGARGEVRPALTYLDEALRSSATGREVLIPALLQNLQNPALIEPLAAMLERDPPWADLFWGSATEFVPALQNTAALRIRMAEAGIEVDPDYDRRLIEGLARTGGHAAGFALARTLQGIDPDTPLVNAGFEARPHFAPYDWEELSSGSRSGQIAAAEGVLRVYSIDGGGGEVAAQIVRMPAGRYRLVAAYSNDGLPAEGEGASFRLTCVDTPGEAESQPVVLPRPRVETIILVPDDGCTYRRLTLSLEPSSARSEKMFLLDTFSIARMND